MAKKRPSHTDPDSGHIYDKIFREIMDELAFVVLARFKNYHIKGIKKLDDKLPTTTLREVDFLYEVEDETGNSFLLHIEFQGGDDMEMLYRMYEYHGILVRKYKLPIKHFVFYFWR
ncbi:MAG: hypothetical protein R2795_09985 [Saprospiraceae bacterium]